MLAKPAQIIRKEKEMKLASLKQGRDGKLVVVSRDLLTCIVADYIAPTLQNALDNWDSVSPKLAQLSDDLNTGKIKGESLIPPRAIHPCPAPINGSTAVPITATSGWPVKQGELKCRPILRPIP